MKRKARKRAPKPKSVDGRKRLTPKEIAALAKQIKAGDHAPSYERMRLACEARNWVFLESCANEHIRRAPDSPRPYLYLGIAVANLDRLEESVPTIAIGYERCSDDSEFMNEIAIVLSVLGHPTRSLHYFVLGKYLASGKGDKKNKLIRLKKEHTKFLKANGIEEPRKQ